MPVASTPSTSTDDETPERNRRLVIVFGALGAVSAVIAALVIFSSGASTTRPKDPEPHLQATDNALLLGQSDARTRVVVYEVFGSPESREFEIASRDFLRVEAAQGHALVEYHPVALLDDDFSAGALGAWGRVLQNGRASQALAFHDLLFDQQPASDEAEPSEFIALARQAGVKDGDVLDAVGAPDQSWLAYTRKAADAAGVDTTPTVLVDGKRLTAASPTALADRIQRMILED